MATGSRDAPVFLITACDSRYARYGLNLIASVQANSALFDKVFVYDLGMRFRQRWAFRGIRNVELRTVAPFMPHWRQCYSWKPWIWRDAPEGILIYLDSGVSVLRSLREIVDTIDREGYFLVTQGYPCREIIPDDYYEELNVDRSVGSLEVVAAGVIGFTKPGAFYENVIDPLVELVKRGYNLGWSAKETSRNVGLNHLDHLIIRDCPVFRHDQTLLTMQAYNWKKSIIIHPMRNTRVMRAHGIIPTS